MNTNNGYIHDLRLRLIDFLSSSVNGKTVLQVRNEISVFYNAYNVIVANAGNCPIFRVRKIEKCDEHNNANDVWCPPAKNIKYLGRANDIGQSIFYGAFDQQTAISEVKISPGERYSLAAYSLRPRENYNMTSVVIRQSDPLPNMTQEIDFFAVELSRFMVNEFTKDVQHGNENQYLKSCAIAQLLLDLPHKDSLLYPSVKNKDATNLAMKETDAKSRLQLSLVLTCECRSSDDHVVAEVKSPNDDGTLSIDYNYNGSPKPITMHGPQTPFSTTFHNSRISSSKEIISHFVSQQGKLKT
jgi:hypothetical protein